jgi:hypothetical protein
MHQSRIGIVQIMIENAGPETRDVPDTRGESLLVFGLMKSLPAQNCLALRSMHDSFLLAQGRGHWRALSGAGDIYKR